MGGLIGAVVGSYVTTVALRTTDEAAPAGPRSLCDGCRRPLAWFESAPVVAYVALRGRCRTCAAPISIFHPTGEVVGLVVGASIALAASGYRAALLTIMAAALLATSIIDARIRILPDAITAIVALLATALAATLGGDTLAIGLIAAFGWYVVLGVVAMDFKRRRGKIGLGWGDIKLIAALSIWLGAASPWMLFIAMLLAQLIVALSPPQDRKLVTGPMIAVAGFTIGLLLEAGIWPRL